MLKFDPDKCPTKILAGCLGITPDRVGRLHKQGILTQTAKGKYDLLAACEAYRRFKQTTRKADTYSAASLELKRELARKQRIGNKRVLAKLLHVAHVQELVAEITHTMSSAMDALPARVAELTADMTDTAEIRGVILQETRAIRTNVADRILDQGGNGAV